MILMGSKPHKNRYIGNFMYTSFAFCILYCMYEFYVIFKAHPFQWPSPPPPPITLFLPYCDVVNSLCPGGRGGPLEGVGSENQIKS
jgi:hypothetical protein